MQKDKISVLIGLLSWTVFITTAVMLILNVDVIESNRLDSTLKTAFLLLFLLLMLSVSMSCVGINRSVKEYRTKNVGKRLFIASMCLNVSFIAICMSAFLFSIYAVSSAMMGI